MRNSTCETPIGWRRVRAVPHPRPAGPPSDRAPAAQPDPGRARRAGSLRAADIARDLGIPANQASFHLRQLAKYGLIEPDAEAARDKRDRVWRLAYGGDLTINLEDVEGVPGGAAAARVFRSNALAWGQYVLARAYGDERVEGEHRSLTNSSLRLTNEEARALTNELREVVERHAAANRGRDSGRSTYLYLGALLPHPDPAGVTGGDD